MAIKSRRNFKVQQGTEDLTLEAKTGESLLIKDVRIFEDTAVYANFLIQRTSVGFFRVTGLLGNHLHFHPGRASHSHDLMIGADVATHSTDAAFLQNAGGADQVAEIIGAVANADILRAFNMSHTPSSFKDTLLAYLGRKGIFKGYPIAEGEIFTIELCTCATAVKMVEYEIHDAGDMTPDMENGSESKSYLYVNYGGTGAALQAVVETVLDETNNPTEYPNFPFGGIVPSGRKMELFGVLASDLAPAANVTGAATYTDYLKFMKGREVLFDEDHNGLLYMARFVDPPGAVNMIGEGYAVGGNYTQCDLKQPHMFDPPIVFNEGEELSISWHVVIDTGGAAISEALQEVGLILRISPMAG